MSECQEDLPAHCFGGQSRGHVGAAKFYRSRICEALERPVAVLPGG
jgi:hypothetical protein